MADLSMRISVELEQIELTLAMLPSAEKLMVLSPLECAGTASLIHNFYNGIENVIKQVFQHFAFEMPNGYSWHRELLEFAGVHGVISEGSVKSLAPFLAFRHFFVHGYAVRIEAERLAPLLESIAPVYSKFKNDVFSFISA